MALTRAQVETILVERLSGWMTEAALAVTHTGANASLNDPIGYAARRLGLTVANVTNVADSDLSAVGVDDYDCLFDVAELRTLENILRNLTRVDTTAGPLSQSFGQLRKDVQTAIDAKRAQIENDYAAQLVSGPQMQAGNLILDLSFTDDDLSFVSE
jgi:hypothetical protein